MSAHDRTIRGMIQGPRGPSQVSRPKADSHRDLDAVAMSVLDPFEVA